MGCHASLFRTPSCMSSLIWERGAGSRGEGTVGSASLRGAPSSQPQCSPGACPQPCCPSEEIESRRGVGPCTSRDSRVLSNPSLGDDRCWGSTLCSPGTSCVSPATPVPGGSASTGQAALCLRKSRAVCQFCSSRAAPGAPGVSVTLRSFPVAYGCLLPMPPTVLGLAAFLLPSGLPTVLPWASQLGSRTRGGESSPGSCRAPAPERPPVSGRLRQLCSLLHRGKALTHSLSCLLSEEQN